jgi:hypothetical protein
LMHVPKIKARIAARVVRRDYHLNNLLFPNLLEFTAIHQNEMVS